MTMTEQLDQLETEGLVAPDTASLLSRVVDFVERFVSFKSWSQIVAVSLWVLHTYVVDAADVTPYLAVTSAEKRSGKTRLLETLEVLVRRPALVAHISSAALYRTIEVEAPTLLFDETDAIFHKNAGGQAEALRGILNAGYRRGATVRLCAGEGKKMQVVAFPVFCAKALSGIGNLPDTIADRAIRIRMERRTRKEQVERFRRRFVEDESERIRDALETWAIANQEALKFLTPTLPDSLDDRQQDAWEPLLAIADHAGGTWPEQARAAAVELAEASEQADQDSLGVLLLEHIRDAIGASDRISTDDLLHALCDRDDAPWAEWWGRDVKEGALKGPAARLSRILKPYEVRPTQFKDAGEKLRGYRREHLEPLWERYLSPPSDSTVLGTNKAEPATGVPSTEKSGDGERVLSIPEIASAFSAEQTWAQDDLAVAAARLHSWNASLPPAPSLSEIPTQNGRAS
jgi:hypothetical protein